MTRESLKLTGEAQMGAELARAELERFVRNPGLDKLAKLYGVEEMPNDLDERLQVLQVLAANHWDYRRGVERQAVEWNDALVDDPESEAWRVIFEAGDDLGLVQNTEPANKQPDWLVILGGGNNAPLDRLRFGLEQVDDCGQIVYIGSTRPLPDEERRNVSEYAPNAQTEFDLGCAALEQTLGAKEVYRYSRELDGGDIWTLCQLEYQVGEETRTAFALCTPFKRHNFSVAGQRATTYDNYMCFAGAAELAANPDQTVVAVTTGFYIAGQHLPAVQELTLLFGTPVETIGHSAEYSGKTRTASQLLQETKSAIDAAVRLNEALLMGQA